MRIAGRWRITEAELWDCDALNLVAPAFIEFAEDGSGRFGFIAVQGEMDRRQVERDGRPGVEFSWEGNDESDPASGRGWAVLEEDGSLSGRIFFHLGDDSGFTAVREAAEDHLGTSFIWRAGGTVSQLRAADLRDPRLVVEAGVARTHLVITVELVHGMHTGDLWPRPGRVLIAARTARSNSSARLAAPVHRRPAAGRPAGNARDHPGRAAAVLGLGRHPRPVRPPLGRRRRQQPHAQDPQRAR